jgi:polyisoprenoid-binding protein YceI
MTASDQLADPRLRALLADGALAGTWILDPARSTVSLHSRSMWGLVAVNGAFGTLVGEGVVSPTGDARGTVTVGSASVDTKVKRRDEHLRSAEFFDSARYPHIVFTADRVTLAGPGVTVDGSLSVRDRTLPLSFPATVTVLGDGELRLDAEVVVDRSAYGMMWSPMRVATMRTTITVRAVFART